MARKKPLRQRTSDEIFRWWRAENDKLIRRSYRAGHWPEDVQFVPIALLPTRGRRTKLSGRQRATDYNDFLRKQVRCVGEVGSFFDSAFYESAVVPNPTCSVCGDGSGECRHLQAPELPKPWSFPSTEPSYVMAPADPTAERLRP